MRPLEGDIKRVTAEHESNLMRRLGCTTAAAKHITTMMRITDWSRLPIITSARQLQPSLHREAALTATLMEDTHSRACLPDNKIRLTRPVYHIAHSIRDHWKETCNPEQIFANQQYKQGEDNRKERLKRMPGH